MTGDWLPDLDDLQGFDNYVATPASTSSVARNVELVKNPVSFPRPVSLSPSTNSPFFVHGSFEATVHKLQHFRRFSAFSNDRRIRRDPTLLPGTYITSVNDAQQVNTGLSAVARYALPTHAPAIYRFDVTIPSQESRNANVWYGKTRP